MNPSSSHVVLVAWSAQTVCDDACWAENAAETFQTVEVVLFRSQQCRRRSRLHGKRSLSVVKPFSTHFSSLGSFLFLGEFPAWPFFGKPFFGTRQYCRVMKRTDQLSRSAWVETWVFPKCLSLPVRWAGRTSVPMASKKEQLSSLFFVAWTTRPLYEKLSMGFRRAKFTQRNTNRQKALFVDDRLRGHHPRLPSVQMLTSPILKRIDA